MKENTVTVALTTSAKADIRALTFVREDKEHLDHNTLISTLISWTDIFESEYKKKKGQTGWPQGRLLKSNGDPFDSPIIVPIYFSFTANESCTCYTLVIIQSEQKPINNYSLIKGLRECIKGLVEEAKKHG